MVKWIIICYCFQSLRVLDYNRSGQEYQVRVLDCDTISQVKEKILDHIFKATPYSSRPAKDDLDLGK